MAALSRRSPIHPEPLGKETAALDTRREFEGNDVSGSTEKSVLDCRRNGGTIAGVCHGRTDRDDQTWLRTCVSRVGWRVPSSARGLAREKSRHVCVVRRNRPATKVFRVTSLLLVGGVCVYTHSYE